MGAQQVDYGEEQVRRERMVRRIGEEREQREQQRCLVVHAAIVRGDIVGVEIEAFLDWHELATRCRARGLAGQHTSLEARNGCGQLDAASEPIWQMRECLEQEQAESGSGSEESGLLPRIEGHGGLWSADDELTGGHHTAANADGLP